MFSLFFLLLATLLSVVHSKQNNERELLVSPRSIQKRAENMTFVQNSGICETTNGVGQASGYVNITARNRMFFWFFEARNSPETAPLTLWLNGGPGCSSMLGLFQEIGPCTVNEDGLSTTLNPYSWTNVSNVIFVDQPIGAGFSAGPATVSNTDEAADDIWIALQFFLSADEFSSLQGREFVIATESYGARYAPAFAEYFNSQNAKIDNGTIQGVKIDVVALVINNGKHDPLTQMASTIPFSTDAPGYGPLVNDTVLANITDAFEISCKGQLEDCYASKSTKKTDAQCQQAIINCTRQVFLPSVGTRDANDLRQQADVPETIPSNAYLTYLAQKDVLQAIGVDTKYDQCSDNVKSEFSSAGETGRSFLPPLANFANSGMPLLIWAGDADMKSNWIGVHDAMVAMDWYGAQILNNTEYTNMTINGEPVASYKVVDKFTYARVFGAGHAMPAFKPQVALEIFTQFMNNEQLHSIETATEDGDDNAAIATRLSSLSLFAVVFLGLFMIL